MKINFVIPEQKAKEDKTGFINDPLGQTHSLIASSEHCFLLFRFARFWKVVTDGRMDNTRKNNYHYQP